MITLKTERGDCIRYNKSVRGRVCRITKSTELEGAGNIINSVVGSVENLGNVENLFHGKALPPPPPPCLPVF